MSRLLSLLSDVSPIRLTNIASFPQEWLATRWTQNSEITDLIR
jgi:hypothetical protein